MMFLLSIPAHFTNDLMCLLFICFLRSYRLLLGAIIMMGCDVRWRGSAEREFKKKNVITYRLDEFISNDIHWFCRTAAKTHSRMAESKGVLLMADKGVYHLQKVGFNTPRGERVQVTHQQNTVGFLYGLLTSTKPGTCVPSLQAERAETLSAKWQLFLPRLHLSVYD